MSKTYSQDAEALRKGAPKSKRLMNDKPFPKEDIAPASDEARNAGTTKRGHVPL